MRIIIEPTEDQEGKTYPYKRVTVEMPGDDLTIGTVVEELIRPALLAMEFTPELVDEWLGGGPEAS